MDEAPTNDDALLDAWDAYLRGESLGDRISQDDQEAITMLHARAWSPVTSPAFRAALRTRLTARPAPVASVDAAEASSSWSAAASVPTPGIRFASPRAITRRPPLRVALAAAVILALLASFGDPLGGDPAPTVQAPVGFVAASPASGSRTAGWRDCGQTLGFRSQVASAWIDTVVDPEFAAPLAIARYVTVQELSAVAMDSAVPPSSFTSGVSGVVIDTVVSGGAGRASPESAR